MRDDAGHRAIYRDLPDALAGNPILRSKSAIVRVADSFSCATARPAAPPLDNTNDHLLGVLDLLAENPDLCSHLEMETYTWEVLPAELKIAKRR